MSRTTKTTTTNAKSTPVGPPKNNQPLPWKERLHAADY